MSIFASKESRGIREATWTDGKRILKGEYRYNRYSDNFTIWLDKVDRDTGQQKTLVVYDDTPEWDKWKLVRK